MLPTVVHYSAESIAISARRGLLCPEHIEGTGFATLVLLSLALTAFHADVYQCQLVNLNLRCLIKIKLIASPRCNSAIKPSTCCHDEDFNWQLLVTRAAFVATLWFGFAIDLCQVP